MIYLVVGLPGSGKTTYLKDKIGTIIDDIEDMNELPEKYSGDLFISDIRFCITEVRERAKRILVDKYGDEIIEIFFTNDPHKSIQNIKNRNDDRIISDKFVTWLSNQYVIPCKAKTEPTYG